MEGTRSGAAPPIREERKVVTALFADIVGSTALAESLDPEDVRDVIGEAIARICLAVEDLGGTVKDLAGEVMAGTDLWLARGSGIVKRTGRFFGTALSEELVRLERD